MRKRGIGLANAVHDHLIQKDSESGRIHVEGTLVSVGSRGAGAGGGRLHSFFLSHGMPLSLRKKGCFGAQNST